tara:strand:- start:1283 stop:1429 length:147 start_codon:yes stop_codon:yes gene_type:complete
MLKFFKNMLTLDFKPVGKTPLKYREANYTLAELERRLNAEVNGFRSNV